MTPTSTGAVLIEHHTSLPIAIRILKERQLTGGPILGDAGLNALIVNHPAGRYNWNIFERTGAVLTFEWTGEVSRSSYTSVPQLDVLYDQYPHRAFVSIGNQKKLLRLVALKATDEQWRDLVSPQSFDIFRVHRPSMWRNWWLARSETYLQKLACSDRDHILEMVAGKPEIQIVFPAWAVYRSYLIERYPQLAHPNFAHSSI